MQLYRSRYDQRLASDPNRIYFRPTTARQDLQKKFTKKLLFPISDGLYCYIVRRSLKIQSKLDVKYYE